MMLPEAILARKLQGTCAARILLASSAACVVFAACTETEANRPQSRQVRDSVGIRIVEYESMPDGLESWSVQSVPARVIGAIEGEGAEVFGRIDGVAVLSTGAIVVADGLNSELRAFDHSGRHLWTAGRRGQGPGEFASLVGAFAMVGDSVLAVSSGRTASVFNAEGTFVRQFRLDAPPAGYPGGPTVRGATTQGLVASAFPLPPSESGYYRVNFIVVFLNYAGARMSHSDPMPWGEGILAMHEGGAYSSRLAPLARSAQVSISPTTAAVTTQDRFEILLFDAGGTVRTLIRVHAAPTPVDDPLRERYLRHIREETADSEGAALSDRLYPRSVFPESLPALGRIHIDAENRLWIEEYVPPYEDRLPAWWVLDASGSFVAKVAVPRLETIYHIDSRHAVAVTSDSLGVRYVQIHTITRG